MAQLIKIGVLEFNDAERVEDILINVRTIREDTISDELEGCEFFVGGNKYLTTTTAAELKAEILNYDANVVIPLQVFMVDGAILNSEVSLSVDKIEIGYVDGDKVQLVIRNHGFLQSWIVTDTMDELADLANIMSAGGGTLTVANLIVTGTVTVGETLDVTGVATFSDDVDVAGDLGVTGDIGGKSIITEEDAIVGRNLAVAGISELIGDLSTEGNIDADGEVTAAKVRTPEVDTIEAGTLILGETAERIETPDVGVSSDNTYTTYTRPGVETLSEGTGQALTGVYLTLLEAGDEGMSTGVLDNGEVRGQEKKIWMVSTGGGTWQVTFSSIYNILFTTQGEWITLKWNGTIWETLDMGICDGAPVVGVS